jgi:hypothetical protein
MHRSLVDSARCGLRPSPTRESLWHDRARATSPVTHWPHREASLSEAPDRDGTTVERGTRRASIVAVRVTSTSIQWGSALLYNVIETGVVYKFELHNPQEAFNAVDRLVEPTRGKYDAKLTGEWDRSWRITNAAAATGSATPTSASSTVGGAAQTRRFVYSRVSHRVGEERAP